MKAELKFTNDQQEKAIVDIFQGGDRLRIPLFQRPFTWQRKHFDQLWSDVEKIEIDLKDDSNASQFLGVLVLVPTTSAGIGAGSIYDVVDGQQRLTTLYLAIMAAAYALHEREVDRRVEAVQIFQTVGLAGTAQYQQHGNTRLIPSAEDGAQFTRIWSRIQGIVDPTVWRGNEPTTDAGSGYDDGKLTKCFDYFDRKFKALLSDGGYPAWNSYLSILTRNLSFVTIDLKDPLTAPQVFERLNARGEKIDIADLVRNELFSRTKDISEEQNTFKNHWKPFVSTFTKYDVDFAKLLFPYGLLVDPATAKKELFIALRKYWGIERTTRELIDEMQIFSAPLILLESGKTPTEHMPNHMQNVARRYSLLNSFRVPSTTYPFLFGLWRHGCSHDDSIESILACLDVFESFVVRRALCGHEPSGLHAVFKGMWKQIEDQALHDPGTWPEILTDILRSNPTVKWPDDEEIKNALRSGNFYARKISRSAMLEREKAVAGSELAENEFQIEHLMPQKPSAGWSVLSTSQRFRELNSAWGNLVLITGVMNAEISNGPWEGKRERLKNSVFAGTREVALENETWNLEAIEQRSIRIAQWCCERWCY